MSHQQLVATESTALVESNIGRVVAKIGVDLVDILSEDCLKPN